MKHVIVIIHSFTPQITKFVFGDASTLTLVPVLQKGLKHLKYIHLDILTTS